MRVDTFINEVNFHIDKTNRELKKRKEKRLRE